MLNVITNSVWIASSLFLLTLNSRDPFLRGWRLQFEGGEWEKAGGWNLATWRPGRRGGGCKRQRATHCLSPSPTIRGGEKEGTITIARWSRKRGIRKRRQNGDNRFTLITNFPLSHTVYQYQKWMYLNLSCLGNRLEGASPAPPRARTTSAYKSLPSSPSQPPNFFSQTQTRNLPLHSLHSLATIIYNYISINLPTHRQDANLRQDP